MSYPIPEHRNRVLAEPETPLPDYVRDNLPQVAREYGFADMCDGVRNLGNIEIMSPEEERICTFSYTNDLRSLAESQEDIPPELSRLLQVKIACGAVSVRELALLAFDFPNNSDLITAALPRIKSSSEIIRGVFRSAETFGYITDLSLRTVAFDNKEPKVCAAFAHKGRVFTGAVPVSELSGKRASSGALLPAYAALRRIDLSTIGEPPAPIFSASTALEKYVHEHGGAVAPDKSDPAATLAIQEIFRTEFEDQIFYPNPVEALRMAYGDTSVSFETFHPIRTHFVCENVRVEIKGTQAPQQQRKIRRGKTTNEYDVQTLGPNKAAAQRSAARVILRHIGATDPALLEQGNK